MVAAIAAIAVPLLLYRNRPNDDPFSGRSPPDPDAELASPGPAIRSIAALSQAPTAGPVTPRVIDPVDRSLAMAREVLQVGGSLNLAGTATPRDRLKALIEDLNATLKRVPDQSEVRLQRARAHRRAGSFLAAISDLGQVIRRDPQNTAAVAERLLASYQLHVLYLGNLNEKALRPIEIDSMRDDASYLERRGNSTQKHVAALAVALAHPDHERARRIAESGPPGSARPGDIPDVRMVEADALFHAAEAAYAAEQSAEGPEKDSKQRKRQELVNLASTALRRGLDADPNHVGLLFLQADTFQRLAVWDTTEDGDRASMIRRQRRAFEASLDHLRTTCMMGTCESAVAWTVLLSNFDRFDRALERVDDALSCNPTLPYLHTVKAWLRLQAPPDGSLTSEEVAQILGDFQAAFKSPPEEFNPYFVRALLHATSGKWESARHDLRTCRRKLTNGALPTGIAAYNTWLAQADASLTRYLDATSEVLNYLAVPVDVRISLSQAVLKRLTDTQGAAAEGIAPDEIKTMKGWTHVRLAAGFAAKNDKAGVLEHAREALAARLSDLTPKTFTDDSTFAAWNGDPEFTELYKQYLSNGGS
jgi:tetratricopeptide (TPR) repeat protein